MATRFDRSVSRNRRLERPAAQRRLMPLLLQALESRVLLSVNPTGSVDVFTATTIAGWARDADVPNQSIMVQITIDGVNTDVTANLNRQDLANAFGGSGNWGFSYTPNLAPGTHQVTVSAIDPQTNVVVPLKQGNLTNNVPIGNADIITSTRIAGWAFDKDLGSGPVTVRIDSNGQTVDTVTANLARPDLTAAIGSPNHGFDVTGNFGVVDIWAIDSPTGTPVLIKSTDKTPVGNVEVLGRSAASGWVYDPDNPTAAVTVEVKVDGQVVSTVTANTNRPDLASVTGGSTDHGFAADYTLSPGSHNIQVFAEDSDTTSVKEVLLGSSAAVSNPAPTGSLDVVSTTNVTGWAFDADAGANPVTVQVFVDGTLNATGTANIRRPDIVGVTGSPNHGYSINLTGVNVAPHRIQIDALDVPTGAAVQIANKVIDNTPPRGSIDMATPATLAGWAQDPDDPTTAIQIIPILDGTAYPAATAGDTRNDLIAAIGSANHGFTYQMPTNLFGVHTVQLEGVDTFDGSVHIIATKQFTNNAPVGNIDAIAATGVAGWAFDKDDPTKSIDVLIQIDGTIVARATANINRPDLAGVTGGSTAHGFSIGYSGLPHGQHTIEVFAVDPATGVTKPIGTKIINV